MWQAGRGGAASGREWEKDSGEDLLWWWRERDVGGGGDDDAKVSVVVVGLINDGRAFASAVVVWWWSWTIEWVILGVRGSSLGSGAGRPGAGTGSVVPVPLQPKSSSLDELLWKEERCKMDDLDSAGFFAL
ncbi:hypothetical protein B7463_g2567, partial [Scytalidium lignicola]